MDKIDVRLMQGLWEQLPEKGMDLMVRILLTVVTCFIGIQVIRIIRKIVRRSLTRFHADLGVTQFLDSLIKIGLYAILLMFILTGFGVESASIIAVLGSAGVAIGLALQGSLSNLAGGVLILLLKPFRVGDYIIEDTNKNEGVVSEIQIFYTKLTTADNRTIVLPNGTLANSSLTNVTDTPYRRVEIQVGVTYDSDIPKAKEVLMRLMEEDEKVLDTQERLVFVECLAESSVILGIRCWFAGSDFRDGRWRLTENMLYALQKEGIDIAYPHPDVHLKK